MAVYVIPYRGSNFWGAFGQGVGQGMGGLVSNLLKAQLQGMIDRGNEQRKVNQQRAMRAELPPDFSGLTREQQEYALLTNSHYPLLSEDSRNRWDTHLGHNEQTRGWEQQYGAFKDTLGGDAADVLVGMQRAGTDTSIQREFTDIVAPTYNATAVDQGDRSTLVFNNPRNPSDRIDITYDKNLSPQDLLDAELMREGMANALEQTKAKGIVSGLTGKAGGSSWGPEDFAKYRAEILAQMQNLDEESEAYKNLADQLYAMDKFIGSIYGYGWGSPQPQAMPQAASQAQVNATARQIMDEARARGIDIPMSQALEEARRALGITQ